MGTAIKHLVPDRVKPSFVIFDIRALWRSAKCWTVSSNLIWTCLFRYQAYQVVAICGRRSRCSCAVPQYRPFTAGRRSFPVAAYIFWNTLPADVQSAPSVSSFRQQLNTFLFRQSFPDILVSV